MLLVRLGAVLATAAVLVVGGGSIAAAHVSVNADEAVQGGTTEIAFHVPTESDTANTVAVRVAFPMETPIAKVSVLPQAGWTYRVTKAELPTPVSAGHGDEVSEVVSEIEWRAAGPDAGVKPGEYQVFRVSAGPLPSTDQLVFKVLQSYGDGQVQRWIEEPVAGGPEPEQPAPVLALGPGQAEHDHEVATVGRSESVAAPQSVMPWATIALVALIVALGSLAVTIRTARQGGGDRPA
jgi:periplasmic copper chaperone A